MFDTLDTLDPDTSIEPERDPAIIDVALRVTDVMLLIGKLDDLATGAALDASELERKATSFAIERRERAFEDARAHAEWYRTRVARYRAIALDLETSMLGARVK